MLVEEDVTIALDGLRLEAHLAIPSQLSGVVIFAHGSGSGRHSPRNRQVAEVLLSAGIGTVLADLLTAEEEDLDASTRGLRFDIPKLAGRVAAIIDWAADRPEAANRPYGLFGASTGAAAALVAAAERPASVRAVVSRGGRPDLAGDYLAGVRAATLLIVGGRDEEVLELNHQAMDKLNTKKELVVVPGATHLFEEPGALEQVAELARDWFTRHLGS
jgi:putative phosphoribosyl transferase